MSEFFDNLIKGLQEIIEYERGNLKLRVDTVEKHTILHLSEKPIS
jgi:hypothetical protein